MQSSCTVYTGTCIIYKCMKQDEDYLQHLISRDIVDILIITCCIILIDNQYHWQYKWRYRQLLW